MKEKPDLTKQIHRRILSGEVPSASQYELCAGDGEDVLCRCCKTPISRSQVQYDVELKTANDCMLILPMHLPCFDAWRDGSASVANMALDSATTIMESSCASIQLLERDEAGCEVLQLHGWRGFHPLSSKLWQRVHPHSTTACGAALQRHQRFCVPDVDQWHELEGTADQEGFQRSRIRAVLSTPLISGGGELVGMLSTHWHRPHQPPESQLRGLDILAREVADALSCQRGTGCAVAPEIG